MAWRDAGRSAKLFGLDASVAIGMLPFMFHWSRETLYFSLVITAGFAVGQFMGIRPIEMFRRAMFWVGGSYRPAPARIGRVRERMNFWLLDRWEHPSGD